MTYVPSASKAAFDTSILRLAAEIVSAYVVKNAVPAPELPGLIKSVYSTLGGFSTGEPGVPSEAPKEPAVSIKKSVTPDFIICLEDGKKFKSLRRHLNTAYGMTPQEYRSKWGLSHDYPMVAPNYSSQRSALAKDAGLGRKTEAVKAKAKPAKTANKNAAAEEET